MLMAIVDFIAGILILRTYAIYNRNRAILVIMTALGVARVCLLLVMHNCTVLEYDTWA